MARPTNSYGTPLRQGNEVDRYVRQVEMALMASRYDAARAAIDDCERDRRSGTELLALHTHVSRLGLHPRVAEHLERIGICTARDLAGLTESQILGMPNAGPVMLSDIRACVQRIQNDVLSSLEPSP